MKTTVHSIMSRPNLVFLSKASDSVMCESGKFQMKTTVQCVKFHDFNALWSVAKSPKIPQMKPLKAK